MKYFSNRLFSLIFVLNIVFWFALGAWLAQFGENALPREEVTEEMPTNVGVQNDQNYPEGYLLDYRNSHTQLH